MAITLKRLIEAFRWRADALYGRLPYPMRVWILERRNRARANLGLSFVDPARLTESYRRGWELLLADDPTAVNGVYLEFGVYYGSSVACMHDALERLGLRQVRIFGFDSFEGLPDSADKEPASPWLPGQYRSSMELIRKFLRKRGVPPERVTLIQGWFSSLTPAQASEHGISRASIVNFDCDLYSSTREALAFAGPLLGPCAIVYFDDWHAAGMAAKGEGQRRAFEEFLAANPGFAVREIDGLEYNPRVKVFMVSRRTRP